MIKRLLVWVLGLYCLAGTAVMAQEGQTSIEELTPGTYTIGGLEVTGTKFLDPSSLASLTGLRAGDEVRWPGDEIPEAISKLWQQGLFEDIQIWTKDIQGRIIFLEIRVIERPRLSRYSISGVRKATADELREKINLVRGRMVTENMMNNTRDIITRHFVEKGFLFTQVEVQEMKDTGEVSHVELQIHVSKNHRVKIQSLELEGVEQVKERKVKRWLKGTKERKWYRIFTASKYDPEKLETDKERVVEKYGELGFRDVRWIKDTLIKRSDERVELKMTLQEGRKYYLGQIDWSGNTKYSDEELSKILGMERGEVYNRTLLNKRLNMDPNSRDISSLYLDDGYLFFSVTPVESQVRGDTIDLEIRIYEGAQATIEKIIVKGNDRTNDKVIYRELRTRPGQKFSRSDIIRSTRELSQLGYFDPEQMGVNPIPHPERGTVDIEYTVAERPSDQIELSGGFGAGRVIGTLGLTLSNFSTRNIFNGKAWKPIPSGDGQRLSLRAQTNGSFYRSYSVSFTEPWLGGKKPNSFSVSLYDSRQTSYGAILDANAGSIRVTGTSVSLGRRLKVPDDYFTLVNSVNLQRYKLVEYPNFIFDNGMSYNLNFRTVLARSSVDQPIYPRGGSLISLTSELTPPYSMFSNKDYSTLPLSERYKLIEYHKWKFESAWYSKIIGNLVLKTSINYGFLGLYDRSLGLSPFERFKLGGDGFSGFDYFQGTDIIALRGYPNNSVAQDLHSRQVGSPIFHKYTMELRYPVTLNPSATLYVLSFLEGGNAWTRIRDFDPFLVKRSAGMGIRFYLPIFGTVGFDYGYGFDDYPGTVIRRNRDRWEGHFILGQTF